VTKISKPQKKKKKPITCILTTLTDSAFTSCLVVVIYIQLAHFPVSPNAWIAIVFGSFGATINLISLAVGFLLFEQQPFPRISSTISTLIL
jgi:predicted small integral membrane protein